MFSNKLEELLVPLEHDQEILFYPIIQKQCYKTSGFKDNLNIKDFIKITFRVKIMYYTGCLKKMVIEPWRAIGHSIFSIQK